MNNVAFALSMPYRTVAAATILALVAWTLGLPAMLQTAQAATLSQISDTISDSDLGVNAAHRIQFGTPNGMVANQNLRITFDPSGSGFDFTGLAVSDIYIVAGANKVDNAGACSGATDVYPTPNTTSDYIDFTVCGTATIASSTTFIIDVGTTTGGNLVNNPSSADAYVIQIGGDAASTAPDSGDTRVAIIDDVTVTAAVDTSFTFTINAVDAGVTVNDDVTTTSATSTATTVPFGTLAPGVAKLMAQELRVDTNALNGFSVSVFADQTLTAGNNATIDEFVDGSAIASTTLWAGPTGTLGSTDTYGHWGITTDDNVVSGDADQWGLGYAAYRGDFVGEANPVEVFYNNTPVTYAQGGQGVGSTTVAYKVEISALQEAAKDYTATLTYIATPVF